MSNALTLSAGTRRALVLDVAALLRDAYVFEILGRSLAEELEASCDRWSGPNSEGIHAWIHQVNAWLRTRSADPHLRLRFQPAAQPVQPEALDELEEACPEAALRAQNFGFRRLEILSDNIGVVDLDLFAPLELAEATATAAMAFLAHTQAVIFDLRRNTGGHSSMVAFLASYFLPGRRALSALFDRAHPEPAENWSIGGAHTRANVPLMLPVGPHTASAAECFAYDLRRLGRATTVGERTLGAAHAIRAHRLHPHVRLVLPYAQVLDPNRSNWHATGVEPDLPCSAAGALDLALAHLRSRSP